MWRCLIRQFSDCVGGFFSDKKGICNYSVILRNVFRRKQKPLLFTRAFVTWELLSRLTNQSESSQVKRLHQQRLRESQQRGRGSSPRPVLQTRKHAHRTGRWLQSVVLERPLEFFPKKSLETQTPGSPGARALRKSQQLGPEQKELDLSKILT